MNRGRLLTPRTVYGVMGTFIYAVGAHLGHLPWWVIGFVGIVLGWRYRLEQTSHPLPAIWIRVGLALLLMMGLLLDMSTLLGRDAGTAFMIGLLAIKFLELRTAWDHMLVCFVCYFLVLGALLFSQTLLMCVYLLTVIVAITAMLVQLHGASERPAWSQLIPAGRLCLQALPLAVVLFLFFPRFHGQLAFSLGQGQTGLSDSLQANGRGVSQLIENDEVAFRAEFPKQDMPAASQMYWRAMVLWVTDGILWRRHSTEMSVSFRPEDKVAPRSLVEQKITVMPRQGAWAFALDYPVAAPTGMVLRPGFTIEATYRVISRKKTYTVFSEVRQASFHLTELTREWALQLPDRVDPRIRSLAEGWKQQARQPGDIPALALRYFQENGFEYSTVPGAYGANPVAEFLFERKKGFCEHYAGAFALLMRLAGVPSRIVVGYQGGEYNPLGDFWVVRQSSAHAWTEVWIEGKGWVRYDPTTVLAPTRLQEGIQALREQEIPSFAVSIGGQRIQIYRKDWEPAWLRGQRENLGQQWDWLNEQWDRYVLSYDADMQQRVLDWSGLQWLGPTGWGLGLVGLMVVLLLAVNYWMQRREKVQEPLREAYAEFCAELDRVGVRRESWEGPTHYTQRVARELPVVAEMVEQLGTDYAVLRYGREIPP